MAIECYYGSCRFHGTREVPPDEGPFCHQRECLATEQELRRFEAERVSEEAERNSGVAAVAPLIPHEGAGVRFCTRQSISQDLNFHSITGVFRDGRFWSADMADHWTPGEVTRWEHAVGVPAVDGGQNK